MTFGLDTLLYLLLLLLLPAAVCAQESRLALVIGNGQYAEAPLSNPINDASDMAAVLEDLGFTVILRTNADRREMGRAIREFGRELKANRGVGLFYYAGHGMQIENRNYLIPIDTPLEEEDEVPYESIDVGSVLAKMESAGNALNLIILDACRNNPFPRQFRSTSRGLARVEAPIGSLVVYATAPGAVAADGDGRNGVFTGALLEQLRTDGLSLTQTIRRTRAAVVQATDGQQVPWESSSLLKDYYFGNNPEQIQARRSIGDSSDSTLIQSSEEPTPVPVVSDTEAVEPDDDINTLAMLDNTPQQITTTRADTGISDDEETGIVESDPGQRPREEQQQTGLATLTVNVDPSDARVRIMNIVEKYKPGILLDAAGSYDIYVTRAGYNAYRETISLKDKATALTITLNKKAVSEPEMIAVAGGTFSRGCTREDSQCEAYEKPVRSINVDPYYISATEITVGQFDAFVASTGYITDAEKNAGGNSGCFIWSDRGGISRSEAKWGWEKNKSWRDPGYTQTSAHPVTCVSWNDANRYTRWMAERSGKAYALPSESEWELAARAVSQSRFGKANTARGLCAVANVADKSPSASGSKWARRIDCTDNYWFSAPVASFQANGFGLYDMQGNAWEWVADAWSDSLAQVPADGRAYAVVSDDEARVLRGGGWNSDASQLRLSVRSKGHVNGRASMTGFRVVIRTGGR